MAKEDNLSADLLRQIISYDPETGVFTWCERPPEMFNPGRWGSKVHSCQCWNSNFAGTVAGSIAPTTGYRHIRINGYTYLAHRLAWLYVTGFWPVAYLDHINGERADNRFANIREATWGQNQANKPRSKNNISGFKGVGWHKKTGKWRVRIMVRGTHIHLGYFDEDKLDDAAAAYDHAARKYHGDFART